LSSSLQVLVAKPIKISGKAERFIQASLKEWAYAQAYQTPAAFLHTWLGCSQHTALPLPL